jgi:hypothetical protein
MKNAHTPGNSPVRIQKLMLKLHLKNKNKNMKVLQQSIPSYCSRNHDGFHFIFILWFNGVIKFILL